MGNNLVFAAPPASYTPASFAGELLWVPRAALQSLSSGIPCLLLQQPGAPRLIIFFHANAEDLGMLQPFAKRLSTLMALHLLAVEYPGYGMCSGQPGEALIFSDAEAVLRFVTEELDVPLDRVLLMGRSLGGAPSIYLASRYACGGLVTLSTFSSVAAVAAGSLLGFGGWMAPDIFNNVRRIRTVRCRTLIIHGDEDTTVDVSQAEELASCCGLDALTTSLPSISSGHVRLDIRRGLGHNGFDVQKDIARVVWNSFPDLQQGAALPLASAPSWLERRAVVEPKEAPPRRFDMRQLSQIAVEVPLAHNWQGGDGQHQAASTSWRAGSEEPMSRPHQTDGNTVGTSRRRPSGSDEAGYMSWQSRPSPAMRPGSGGPSTTGGAASQVTAQGHRQADVAAGKGQRKGDAPAASQRAMADPRRGEAAQMQGQAGRRLGPLPSKPATMGTVEQPPFIYEPGGENSASSAFVVREPGGESNVAVPEMPPRRSSKSPARFSLNTL
eukprot:TRINITY_DN47198_c0_g1_i1.p1 TRINITY_DN47198_c0_g1~~TRINITY_DN47198_c0_g1_i1.p1  ORF type:complete len:497 (+),score=85.78 TRINITY_DN47198_c0_g1_i1:115-1605(+)